MDVIKELLDNARKLLGEMSSTQRASIVTMIITVASLFVLIIWLGSINEKKINVPLEVKVSLAESEQYKTLLLAGGITEVEYDMEAGLLMVPEAQKRKALVILAENKALPTDTGDGFEAALEKVKFTDTKPITAERMKNALQTEVARMIEDIKGISKAEVIYTSAERKGLFRQPYRQRAAVKVTTEMNRKLDQGLAETIINLVTFARAGLDENDVSVTDQFGNNFRKDTDSSINMMAVKEIKLNSITSERARREIESCVRKIIPDSEVYAFVDTKWDMTRKVVNKREILEGRPNRIIQRKIDDNSSDKPSNVVGTQPNIRRSTNMETGTQREIMRSYKRQDKDTNITLGELKSEEVIAPTIKSQTVAVVVHLPAVPTFDANGKPVYEKDASGNQVLNPNTGAPLVKLKAYAPLEGDKLLALESSVRKVAGMLDGADNMEVQISQIPWTPTLEPDKRKVKVDYLREFLNENVVQLVMMAILMIAIYLVYLQAKRSIPAEEVELPDTSDFGGVFSPMSLSEEDRNQADFEQMRDQVGDFIDEDPSKAAGIVRRWMNSREGY